MNNEEKILEILTQVQEEQKQMRGDIHRIDDRLDRLQDDMTHVKARLDYDVDKKLDAINEGVDAIQEAMISKSRVEVLEDDMLLIKTTIKAMSQRIAELEKAQ